MKLFITILLLIMSLFNTQATTPKTNTNINIIDGIVSSIDDEYIYIDTIDGNGWALETTDNEAEALLEIEGELCPDTEVIITFDTMGTDNIYDDEIINIVINDTKQIL